MKDFVGREIRIGDIVVYPMQAGHRIDMRRGKVVKFNPHSLTVRPDDQDFLVSIKRVDNVVVLLA